MHLLKITFVSQYKEKSHLSILSDQLLQGSRQHNKTREPHERESIAAFISCKMSFLVKSNAVWNSVMVTIELILYINIKRLR